MSMQPKRILVVDDEAKIVDVVKSYLEASGYSVVCAYSGKEAFDAYEKANPALIILDLMLPDVSGEEICSTLRKKSSVPIIMLTAKIEEEYILKGLNIGADDYVLKPFSPRQLVARVEAVLRRTAGDTPPVASFNGGDLLVDSFHREVKKGGQTVNLTPNEYKILAALLKYPKKVFTREELISLVSGDDFDGYDRVIDAHIKNLRQKIESEPKNPRYIITVHGVGYRFGGD